MRRKQKIKRKMRLPEISLTPLIDTSLTLVVIFMITSQVVYKGLKVNLPKTKNNEAYEQKNLVIVMNHDGTLMLNDRHLDHSSLIRSMKKAIKGHKDLPVHLYADQTVSYGAVVELIDQLKQVGVCHVAMATRHIQ